MSPDCFEMYEEDDLRSSPPPPNLGSSAVAPLHPDQVLENVLESVLYFLTSCRDCNVASLVCRSWHRAETLTRSDHFIGNCYAVSPHYATEWFRRVRSVVLKGKLRFADFNLMPADWGAHFTPGSPPWPQPTRGSRRSTNEDLADSFHGFKELVLVRCDGFETSGEDTVVE